MVDKKSIDEFILRMEREHPVSESYRQKARTAVYRMLDMPIPDGKAPPLFELIEGMYRLQHETEANLAQAREGLREIGRDYTRVASEYLAVIDAVGNLALDLIKNVQDIQRFSNARFEEFQNRHMPMLKRLGEEEKKRQEDGYSLPDPHPEDPKTKKPN